MELRDHNGLPVLALLFRVFLVMAALGTRRAGSGDGLPAALPIGSGARSVGGAPPYALERGFVRALTTPGYDALIQLDLATVA